MHTPPSGVRLHQREEEASTATPRSAGTQLPGPGQGPAAGGTALRLKSALKQARRVVEEEAVFTDGEGGGEATPLGAGIKKRVRIHSSNNMVHEFQTSHSADLADVTGGAAGTARSGGTSDDDATPDSSGPRRRRPSSRQKSRLVRYNRFLSNVFGPGPSGGSSSGSGRPAGSVRSSGSRSGGSSVISATWFGPLFTLCWMFASSALIFVNKQLMVDHGFRFPFALTAMGQATSTLLAWLAARVGLAPLRPPPPLRTALTKLLPVSLSFAASLFLGNVAYLGLSVAFINIMKAATPLVTLTLGLALGLERMSKMTLAATLLIALGTYAATASEAATGHFHWLSFAAFATSVVFEGIRVVLTEKLLGQARYNVMEALAYLGPFTFAALASGCFLFEWEGLTTTGWVVLQAHPWDFVLATAISFLVNLFCYLAIKYVSATSFKVAGCLKNVLVVWGGILQGDVVTPMELQGYGISLAGFVLFSASRWRALLAGAGQSGDSPTPKKLR